MPRPSFLSGLADKAQSAINATPLAGHLPAAHRPASPDGSAQPSANEAAAQGGHRSHALGAISHQLRTFGQQYSTTSPVQKIITMSKGVAIDFDSVSRDSKAQSKELYTWGQTEAEDLRDVTDRLAYLNFVQGSLSSSLSVKLDGARATFKSLRDAETALTPRRNIRAGIQMQISRIEHDQQKGLEAKILELKDQLMKAERDDGPQEKEVELLKRKAVRESEQIKWEALREYGEKLVLLSQAATPIIAALPTVPPTAAQPYVGAQATGATRASLQRALDNYKTGHINLPSHDAASDLSRSDTASFGESHASELSSINTADPSVLTQPGLPVTPERVASPPTPINPNDLNQSPAPIPIATSSLSASSPVPILTSGSTTTTKLASVTPTVAETGVPVSAGAGGPGPASGSLQDIRGASATAGPRSEGLPGNEAQKSYGQAPSPVASAAVPKYESAEAEKARLQREDRERILHNATATQSQSATTSTTAGPAHETAEEEKKRLAREERERVLRQGDQGTSGPASGDATKKEEDLPPYQDYTE